ncbi:hypothetical protein TrLO_g14033 [Triparma laevis f. longispina]|uniref:Uncharacterized protein n=1 Tax=Triparma laevis f. longispina TaxID=1714387 RepID=A0A9W7AJW3_9STRA|nr:hypothetical protein TrLO_g14033 [Triparma laevis f. longispina]
MGGNKNKQHVEETFQLTKKDAKKIKKLEAQIPYFEGRREQEEAEKIKERVAAIVAKAKGAFHPLAKAIVLPLVEWRPSVTRNLPQFFTSLPV